MTDMRGQDYDVGRYGRSVSYSVKAHTRSVHSVVMYVFHFSMFETFASPVCKTYVHTTVINDVVYCLGKCVHGRQRNTGGSRCW